MGFFRPSRKFTEIPTPEEQYRAAQVHTPSPEFLETQRRLSERWAERRAATEERRSKVVSAGTLRRRGRTVILEGDWKLATGSLPVGEVPRVTHGKLGDLTIKDLHALATNHGPKCQCGLGR
ncbi:hypothetical protein [Streptomyces coeruleorubidus]|jgi:hypothetical protein|uniref:hypothetical protein n=1 Tax=Streptomyces coeruleorubidus TaxID=116188 RepID=UPI0033B3AD2A